MMFVGTACPKWDQERPPKLQYLFGSAESKISVDVSQDSSFWRLKFWVEIVNPFCKVACFVEVGVGNPMSKRPKDLNRRLFPAQS
jgi:hypothetical protein